jgi:hypothetical protein
MTAKIIEARVRRLEQATPQVNDLSHFTDEELHEALLAIMRAKVGDPATPPEAVRRAERMLALPWGRPWHEWETADLSFFHDEAHRED